MIPRPPRGPWLTDTGVYVDYAHPKTFKGVLPVFEGALFLNESLALASEQG